ncbi:hypothetical protein PSECIP111951_02509 [Pseudoalteromonas holothuriae]|uniref:Lipoprotein n=1 Tax=Pseudoalteromonas holothuriae TaxID=2963714 RepID=A0A9W4VP60_9GAMM|nr:MULTISPECIES: hypothetical protein [unclassified Pseudoalteromonas]CAH9053247.1 hypothetical protein PSECIP111854_01133 [Pseudoalteromonas sp. CIP111854]CAH9061534.1 hypothetical protein PSECIP111951_02509 [Pseudoalteromonas sp. CIP111951]
MKHLLIALTTTVFLAACAHHDDVRPGSNKHYVVVKSVDRNKGIKEALGQAEHFCEKNDSKFIVINEKVDYQGEEPEKEYLDNHSTAEFVTEASTWLWILGDGYVDDVAAVTTLAGVAVLDSMGAPYVITVNFRCA